MMYRFVDLLAMFTRPGPRANMPDGTWALAIPEPMPLSIPEKIAACRSIMAGRAVAVIWPECGDVERGLRRYVKSRAGVAIHESRRRGILSQEQATLMWDINDKIHNSKATTEEAEADLDEAIDCQLGAAKNWTGHTGRY